MNINNERSCVFLLARSNDNLKAIGDNIKIAEKMTPLQNQTILEGLNDIEAVISSLRNQLAEKNKSE